MLAPFVAEPRGDQRWSPFLKYPLVMPERSYIYRKLMESAAAMAGVQLRVEWEVSSVPIILDLVSAGGAPVRLPATCGLKAFSLTWNHVPPCHRDLPLALRRKPTLN